MRTVGQVEPSPAPVEVKEEKPKKKSTKKSK